MGEPKPKEQYRVKMPMAPRKSGVIVPSEAIDRCMHQAVFKQLMEHPQINQYVCGDCKEKVLRVVLQFALMTPEEHEEFKKQMMAAQAAARRKAQGIILPGEAKANVRPVS